MNRPAIILVLLTLIASWFGMMIVHETGHVLAALATGSVIDRVSLPWVGFSQTQITKYVRPTVVVAAGPTLGVILPAIGWAVLRRSSWGALCRFFAGFCLVANGGYIASAMVKPAGDADALVALGVPAWVLGVAGCVAVAIGLQLWNGLGSSFGLGRASVPAGAVTKAFAACAVVLGIVLSSHLV